jgi:hemerythrin-like metal-binding protein
MQTEPDDAFIEWDSERYSTAIERFDEQHKRLFELLNDLHTAMEAGRSDEKVGEILRELEQYTEYHFGDEEEFMQDCGYAMDCANCFYNHREMHEEFAQKVTELREKHENGEYISMEVLLFARDWLDSHIAGLNQDQNYGDYYDDEVSEEYEYEPGQLKADRKSGDPHPDDSPEVPEQTPEVTVATELPAGPELSVPDESIAEWFEGLVNEHGDGRAVAEVAEDGIGTRDFTELYRGAIEVAGGLLGSGLEPGDRVGIHAGVRPEWAVVDMACHLAGLVSVPVSELFDEQRAAHVVADAGVKTLVVDREPPEAVRGVPDEVVRIDDLPKGRPAELPGLSRAPDDVATVLYRIGTAEHPNGCALTNRNLRAAVEMLSQALPLDAGATGTCFLPLAHPYQRMLVYYLWDSGSAAAYMSRDRLLEDLAAVDPEVLVGVPAVYQQLYDEILDKRDATSGLKQALSDGVARRVGAVRNEGGSLPTHLSLKHRIADRTVFSGLREEFGLANVEYALTGTDAIDTELLEFFRGFGVPLSEIYGTTELAGLATVNRAGEYDAETVGAPLPGVELALAEDDEVLVSGPNLISGYWNDGESWRQKLSDGWYLTGDLGRIDDGALVIEGPK